MTPNSISSDLEKLLKDRFGDLSKVAILAGAGISVDPPSCVPSAYRIMHAIVDALAPTPKLRDALYAACNADRNDQRGPNNFLRMERLLSLIYPPGFAPRAIDELATAESPNGLHYALAYMASLGAVVITTNFDCLIEKACEKLGFAWRLIVSDKDYEELLSQASGPNTCLIMKVHGSADQPHSVLTTLEEVGRGRRGWNPDQAKGAAVSECFRERNLLVLGYSGSDDFDVIPALLQTSSERAILWVEHDESKPLLRAALQHIDHISAATRSGDVLWRLAQPRMNGTCIRKAANIWRVAVATRELLHWFFAEENASRSAPSDVATRVMDSLREGCSVRYGENYVKWHDAAQLFDEIEDIPSAIECARHGRELAIQNHDVQVRGMFAAVLGRLVHGQGDVAGAIHFLDEAETIARDTSDSHTLSIAWHKKAYIFHQRGQRDKEIALLQDIIALDKTLGKPDWLAMDYGTLAVVLVETNREEGFRYFQMGLKLAREVGDMGTELMLLNDAIFLKGMQTNDSEIFIQLERAEELAISLGHLRGMVEVMGNRGMMLSDQGQWDAALDRMTRAKTLAESLDYPEGVARWESGAADILRRKGNPGEARLMLNHALLIFNHLQIQREIGTTHGRLGLICMELKEYENARVHFQTALELDQAAGWNQGVVDDLGNLGMLFQETGHVDMAYRCFVQAVVKARAEKYEAALARNLGNLGMELSRKGLDHEALKCDMEALDLNIKLGNLEGEAYTRVNMAGDYATMGRVSEAVDELRKAFVLATKLGNKSLLDRLERVFAEMGYAKE